MTGALIVRAVRSLGGEVQLLESGEVRVRGVPLGWRDRESIRAVKPEIVALLEAERDGSRVPA